jgi:GrpB-like predicted nucleotidyltransferase (UPF0157 family)
MIRLRLASGIAADVNRTYRRTSRRVRRLVPFARVHHIGSTMIPTALTKGDLDLLVRVRSRDDFVKARAILRRHFRRNKPSTSNAYFTSFLLGTHGGLDVGMQLTIQGSKTDTFLRFNRLLRGDPRLVSEYNRVKRAWSGGRQPAYRRAKAEFIGRVLGKGWN